MSHRPPARFLAAAATVLVGLGTVATSQAHAVSSCATDCINTVHVAASADGLNVTFTTTTPATTRVGVRLTGGAFVVPDFANQLSSSPAYSHKFVKTNVLKPKTSYTIVVSAYDTKGHFWSENVPFITKNRTLDFTIDKVLVTNDGDAGSAGDLRLSWKIGSVVTQTIAPDAKQVSSGSYWHLSGQGAFIDHAPKTVTVAVEIQDDDADPWDDCLFWELPTWTAGSGDCLDWSTASRTFTLPSSPGSGDSGTVTFSVNYFLGFKVYGHYHWTVG